MFDFVICALTNFFRIFLIDRFVSIFLGNPGGNTRGKPGENVRENPGENVRGNPGEKPEGKDEGNPGEKPERKDGRKPEGKGERNPGGKFSRKLSGSDSRKRRKICVCLVFFVLNTVLYWEFHTAWINIFSNLIGIGAIVRVYTKSVKTNLFVTSSIYLINCGCDVAVYSLFTNYQDGKAKTEVYGVVVLFLILICELVTEKLVTIRKDEETARNFPLILVPLCSIGVIWISLYWGSGAGREAAIVSIGLLVINFLTLYLYNLLLHSVTQKYETAMLAQKVRVYANQLEVIRQSQEKIKALRHDMKHHMNEIRLLADRYHGTEIREYIDRMEAYIENPDEIVSSGNTEIDSVLNYMLQKAREQLENVTVKVVLPEKMKHAFDINILAGNLLENAIEAAIQTDRKYLKVNMTFQKGVLKICVENSYLPEALESGERQGRKTFLTTKKEKERHGIGLESVEKIVEAYNGTMEITPGEELFSVRLVLYMPESNR